MKTLNFVLVFTTLIFLAACQSLVLVSSETVADNKAVVQRWIEEGWNAGNVDVADELYAPDFHAVSMEEGIPDLQGPEAVKAMVLRIRSAFPDIHFRIDHLVAEGDYDRGHAVGRAARHSAHRQAGEI